MHPIAKSLIAEIDMSIYESVARSVVEDSSARLADKPRWTEINAAHADLRTLAILRVEGTVSAGGSRMPWSSVQKVIDTTVHGGLADVGGWIDPAREEAVYELGLFKDEGLKFRPVVCYQRTEPRPGIKMFWLEDLTQADRTPFSIEQLHEIARDLGEFNGYRACHGIADQLQTATDSYLVRWTGAGHAQGIDRIAELADRSEVRRILRKTTLDTVHDLHRLLDRMNVRLQKLQHTLAFGDCNPGNLFRLRGQTVAIDWATVTMDPTGVDAGCLIGAAMIWGKDGNTVLEAERDLFSSYLAGLRSGGWTGEEKHVRQAFFGQFGTYLMSVVTTLHHLLDESGAQYEHLRDFVEKRFQTPFDEIPDLVAPIVDSYPRYIEEISRFVD